jgi:hypothetical protein
MRGPQKICELSDCLSTVKARGLCNKHYLAWSKVTPIEERRLTSADRFWAKVDKGGPIPPHRPELGPCWIWTGATTEWGYGKLHVEKVWYVAHRRSYEMRHGAVPPGLLVCHRCDTPACIRPAHLFLGTSQQNTRDMHSKGRAALAGAKGVRNCHAKLTDAQVLAIRQRFDDGEMIVTLAAEFGLTRYAMSSIVNGRTWKHLGGPVRKPGQIGRRPRKVA